MKPKPRGPMPTTLLAYLDRYPPCMVVATRTGLMKDAIVRSGLPERTFKRIASQTSWATVRTDKANAFMQGCGFDPFHTHYRLWYFKCRALAERPFPNLTAPEVKTLNRRLAKWAQQIKASMASPSPGSRS